MVIRKGFVHHARGNGAWSQLARDAGERRVNNAQPQERDENVICDIDERRGTRSEECRVNFNLSCVEIRQ